VSCLELLPCVGPAGRRRSSQETTINLSTSYDFGRNGRAYRETDAERADLEAVIMDLIEGQYNDPVRVVGFNTAEGWSQDVSEDVAQEVRHRCDLQRRDVPECLQAFTDRYEGRYRDVQLPLPIRMG
jgi:hypothetical protein